ncbi:hypothetical protein ACLKA6_007657 [Drosophila palustris]
MHWKQLVTLTALVVFLNFKECRANVTYTQFNLMPNDIIIKCSSCRLQTAFQLPSNMQAKVSIDARLLISAHLQLMLIRQASGWQC